MERVKTVGDLGDLVRAARAARGWSQREAAAAAGVSRRFVNMLEGGQHTAAEVGRVLALLDALGVHLAAALPTEQSAAAQEIPATHGGQSDAVDLDAYLSTFRTPRQTR